MRSDELKEMEAWSEMLQPKVERRDFLKLLGGGIVVFIALGDTTALAEQRQRRGYPTDFNAYLRIDEDGKVTFFSGKIEMGQGVMTSLAQTVAEELRVDVGTIHMVMGDTESCPWDMGTFGSMTTRMFGPAVLAAAAEAREVLLDIGCEQLEVPRNRVRARNGFVYDSSDRSRRVSYGQLAKGQRIARTLTEKAVLRSVEDYQLIGTSVRRLDAIDKVTGKARFAGDIRLPGMLYARILRPPSHDATLNSVDTSAAARVPGATVVNENGMVAVLHEHPEEAGKALELIKADYDVPEPTVDHETIFEHLLSVAPRANENDRRGDLEAGERAAAMLFEETYLDGYVAHAPIETHTALASVDGGTATVWSSTQTPFSERDAVARALGLPSENVRLITPYVGGGFGGKTGGRQSSEAAILSKATGRPVQVAWSRAEEFFYDSFRPAAVIKIKSGVDRSGRICLWDYNVFFAGSRGSDQFYDVANNIIRVHGEWRGGGPRAHPFSTGAWRAPGANTNVFAKESQIDIMAAKAGIDPLEFRLNNTTDARMIRVLKAVAERFGWKKAPAPSGRGYGIACGIDAGTYVAHMAEVEVDRSTGRVDVKRIVCSQDMGIVINPDGAIMQMEGCITMGLGYTLSEDIRFRGGEILDRNFDTYELPRFSGLPEIETVLVKNDELSPQGGGEPAIVPIGGLIANAIFDATGARLHQLPMTPERVREAALSDSRSSALHIQSRTGIQ